MANAGSQLNVAALQRVPRIGCKLNPDTKVYRIVDFFAAAQLIRDGRLHLTCIHDYGDRNEGIDRLAQLLVMSVDGRGPGDFEVHDSVSALKQIESERRSRFVSCWSTTVESHAMWAMYSPDRCAVKLQTTVGRLLDAAANALIDSWSSVDDSVAQPLDRLRPMVCEADVFPARYENLHRSLPRLARRAKLARRLVDPNKRWDAGNYPESLLRAYRRWERYFDHMFLKDESYSYESEIRVCIRIGHVSRLDKLRETMTGGDVPLIDDPNLSLPEQYALLIKRRLQVQPFLPTELAPRAYKVPIASGFLESVCIDPRAAAHKREFMESYFATNGVRIEKSKSFDAAYIELQAYPGLKT